MVTHAELCEMLEIAKDAPSPRWTSYSVQKTIIEVYVNRERKIVFGGAQECMYCGFGISMIPSERTEPKARQDGKCPKCANTGVREGK